MASFEQFEREIMGGGGVEGPQEFDEVEEGEVRQKSGQKYALLTRNSSSIRITHAISARGEGGDRNGGKWKNLNKYALACALLASLNSTLLGYDIGVIAGAVLFIKEDLLITDVQEELLVGSLNIVSLVGAASAGRIADAVGRRWTMSIAALFFLVGAAVMGAAPNFGLLMVGRLLEGIGVGFALMIAPVYTAELAPASSRGSLVSLPEIFINLGILLGYIVSYSLAGLPAKVGWRVMLTIGILPATCLAFGVLFMPESPRWLVMQNRIDEAKCVLQKTSNDKEEAHARLLEIMDAAGIIQSDVVDGHSSTRAGPNSEGQGVWKELLWPTPAVRRMLILALGLQFFQQASGIDATVYYSPVVFQQAGITGRSGVLLATVAVGLSKTLFILVATAWLDSIGRRPLLLTSAIGMTFSLLILAIGFLFLHVTPTDDIPVPDTTSGHGFVPVLAILAICSYVAFFSIGFGPILWVLTSEIFPLRLRAQSMGLGIVVNRLASGTVALTFLSMAKAMTVSGTFFLFSSVAALSAVFVYIFAPETKGQTLEGIAVFFERDSDRVQPSPYMLEMGSIPEDSHAMMTSSVQRNNNSTKESHHDGDEEDLNLMEHDGLKIAAMDETAARKQLLMRVKSIAKQGPSLDPRFRAH